MSAAEVTDKALLAAEMPYKFDRPLGALVAWIIRMKDGNVVRYVVDVPNRDKVEALITTGKVKRAPGLGSNYTPSAVNSGYNPGYYTSPAYSLSPLCAHKGEDPVFTNGNTSLFICDASGARASKYDQFDLVIDGGGVLTDWAPRAVTYGDAHYTSIVRPFEMQTSVRRVLKVDWTDRSAPLLAPQAWIELAKALPPRVMTCCQGGHGRSGTALVALMMCLTDYDPLDAITHLRAAHCPRAIESKIQHDYLDWLAEVLGREQNAHEAEKVTDYRGRFLTLTSSWGDEARARLLAKGGTKDVTKRD